MAELNKKVVIITSLKRLIVLFGVAAFLFFLTQLIDLRVSFSLLSFEKISYFFYGDPDTMKDALINMAQTLGAVLGVTMSVLLIIVQLTSERSTTKAVKYFIYDNITFYLISSYILAIIYNIWIANSIKSHGGVFFVPLVGIIVALVISTLALGLLIPYFYYIFEFLQPANIVNLVKKKSITCWQDIINKSYPISKGQEEVANNIEEIGNVCINSINQMDVELGITCIRDFRELLLTYLDMKSQFPSEWFEVKNIEIFGFSQKVLQNIEQERTWVEVKVLQKMNFIVQTASNQIKDINHAIALSIRQVGEKAIVLGDEKLLTAVVKAFNSFLKSTLNSRDAYSCGNFLFQYRLLTQDIIKENLPTAEKVVFYFSYYAQIAAQTGNLIVVETICYDLRILIEIACQNKLPIQACLGRTFLALEKGLRAMDDVKLRKIIWKHLLIIAANCEESKFFFERLKTVPYENLLALREMLFQENELLYWELTDRMVNFSYTTSVERERINRIIEEVGASQGLS